MIPHKDSFEYLHTNRPRSRFLQISFALALLGPAFSWWIGNFSWGDLTHQRRIDNLRRFLDDIRPHPLRHQDWDWSIAWKWALDFLVEPGLNATLSTLAISILAISFAALWGTILALPAAKTLTRASPFLPAGGSEGRWRHGAWNGLYLLTRFTLALLRSVPEYILAFLLLAMIGPGAWSAILALAIHNTGILGRLGAETVENLPPLPMASLRALGARRSTIITNAILPPALSRLILYFSVRWETCVREATVLGMLGITSLGFWISEARAHGQYDRLLLLVSLGSLLVLLGDLVSALVRSRMRQNLR